MKEGVSTHWVEEKFAQSFDKKSEGRRLGLLGKSRCRYLSGRRQKTCRIMTLFMSSPAFLSLSANALSVIKFHLTQQASNATLPI
jgi:hypothetical protein